MSPGEVFEALGGGLTGVLGATIVVLAVALFLELKGQIKRERDDNRDLRDDNKELRSAVNRLADVVETWTPDGQRRRLRQP